MSLSYIPITTLQQLFLIDDDECVKGYLSGKQNTELPQNASASFYHGWKNGMIDFGHMKATETERELARNYVSASSCLVTVPNFEQFVLENFEEEGVALFLDKNTPLVVFHTHLAMQELLVFKVGNNLYMPTTPESFMFVYSVIKDRPYKFFSIKADTVLKFL